MEDKSSQLSKIRDAIEGYMAVLQPSDSEEAERFRALACALDRLVEAYFVTTETAPDDDEVDAPARDYNSLYDLAGKAYPELGYYPYADLGGDPGEEGDYLVADAIDDLADIAGDLEEVLWYIANKSSDEAIWHFRFGYQTHWGPHLHSLRHHLNSTRIAAW